jgi:hypothetical protein
MLVYSSICLKLSRRIKEWYSLITVVERIMPSSKDVDILVPGTYEYVTSHRKKTLQM